VQGHGDPLAAREAIDSVVCVSQIQTEIHQGSHEADGLLDRDRGLEHEFNGDTGRAVVGVLASVPLPSFERLLQ